MSDETNSVGAIDTFEIPNSAASLVLTFGRTWAIDPGYSGIILDSISSPDAMRMILEARANGKTAAEPEQKPYIVDGNTAIVSLSGVMAKRPFCGGMFGDETSTVGVRKALRAAAADKTVKQIMLLVESPGGEVDGSFDLADDVNRINTSVKPVDAYIEDIGASAAYLVASQARRVYANRNAVVGSVGVYTTIRDTSKVMEQRGVKVHVVKAGSNKAIGVPGTPVTEGQLETLQNQINAIHSLFIGAVQRGRPNLNNLQLKDISTANCYIGAEAIEMGLVDQIASIDEALNVINGKANASATKADVKEHVIMADTHDESSDVLGNIAANVVEPDVDTASTLPESVEAPTVDANVARQLTELAEVGKQYLCDLGERTKRLAIVALGADQGATMASLVDTIVANGKLDSVIQLRALCVQYDGMAQKAGLYKADGTAPQRKTAALKSGDEAKVVGENEINERVSAVQADLIQSGAYDF